MKTEFKLFVKTRDTREGYPKWKYAPSPRLLELYEEHNRTPFAERKQIQEYATILGVAPATLTNISKIFGIVWTDGRKIKRAIKRDEVIKLREQDKLSFQQIGKMYNFSRQRAHQLYHNNY